MVKRKVLKPRRPSDLKKYNLTVAEWQAMSDEQGGRCFICGRGGRTKHLSIDHDHGLAKRGIMVARGLLCQRCNTALGKFEWSDDVLVQLVRYVYRVLALRAAYKEPGNPRPGIVEGEESGQPQYSMEEQ